VTWTGDVPRAVARTWHAVAAGTEDPLFLVAMDFMEALNAIVEVLDLYLVLGMLS